VQLNPAVYDLWVVRRRSHGAEFLVLRTSQTKADRHFNGGRFWQIPSGFFQNGESVPAAVDRELAPYGLTARAVWAAEHAYTIYNRRFMRSRSSASSLSRPTARRRYGSIRRIIRSMNGCPMRSRSHVSTTAA